MDFSLTPARSHYYFEFEIPLAEISPEALRLLVGDDYWSQMYHQQDADARWEDDGGAYL